MKELKTKHLFKTKLSSRMEVVIKIIRTKYCPHQIKVVFRNTFPTKTSSLFFKILFGFKKRFKFLKR